SPGPWITHGASVGSVRRWIFEDLYEQCSFHIAEKMPSSVTEGSRPTRARMRWYSSGLRPCAATNAGVIFAGFEACGRRSLAAALALRAGGRFLLVPAGGFLVVLAMEPKCHCRDRRGKARRRRVHNIVASDDALTTKEYGSETMGYAACLKWSASPANRPRPSVS